jgi:FeS assembly protein IscX
LTWDSIYEIARGLNAKYPQVDLDVVSLEYVFEWTINLSGFEDDPNLVNDEILLSILKEWYEERFPL